MPSEPATPQQPQRSLNRQHVLEEDEYDEALSQVIARDFFPSLVHLDATNEYLDALQSRDPHLIHASVRRIEEIARTPLTRPRRAADTPLGYAGQTPARGEVDEPPAKRPKYDTSLSLDEFQARYTSEDNASFTRILDDENQARRERWGWAWDAQKRVEAQRDRMLEAREKMMIEKAPAPGVREKWLIDQPRAAGLIEGPKDSNSQALVLQGQKDEEPVDVLARKKDSRSAGVDGWKFKVRLFPRSCHEWCSYSGQARNGLMFPPDADASPYHPPPQTKEAERNPKIVKHANTRLPEQDEDGLGSRSLSQPPSPTRSRIDAAITGTPCELEVLQPLWQSPYVSTDHPRSPKESNFSLVPDLPSPTPAELGSRAVKQLMTWGTITSTPRIIGKSDDIIEPATPFHIPEVTAREALSHKLSNKAAKSLRMKADMYTPRASTNMPPPSMTLKKSGNLTPAGRRLLERTTLGVAASRRADAMERNAGWDATSKGRDLNHVRWTPTPSSSSRR